MDKDDDINVPDLFVDSFAINLDSHFQVGPSIEISRHFVIPSTYKLARVILTVRLLCAEHYYGERCENYNECSALQITCSGHGTCIDGDTCDCNPGYTGRDCETNIDDCAGVNCSGHGTCTDGVGTYTCECNPGYTGRDCETNINECLLMEPQCSGHGTCTDGDNSFICACNDGYTDLMCETNIDDCVGVNCSGHGHCMDNINSFTCNCSEGFTGQVCQANIDDCVGVNCSGHGQCIDGVNNFTCLCKSGFTGVLCSMDIQGMSLIRSVMQALKSFDSTTFVFIRKNF